MGIIERYNHRDLSYSRWHRTIHKKLSMCDIDGLEYCAICKSPLALIETAIDVGQVRKYTRPQMMLALKAGLPFYLVYYKKTKDETITSFRVTQIYPPGEGIETVLTPDQYEKFLIELRKQHTCYKYNTISKD